MCGFVACKNSEYDIRHLLKGIHYRGLPGYVGYEQVGEYQLGHVSLPFVNLDLEKAIQPRKGKPSLFVGEIFNYKELGYEDDIECINTTWDLEGIDGFHKFDGFWTYVTIDRDDLVGVTDHLGIKPLYYRSDVEAMASEPNSLLGFGRVTRNELFHSNVMKWGYDPTGGTPWNEIKHLKPGHMVRNGREYKYWDWDRIVLKDNLYDTLKKSVDLRLGGQREVAVLLSGGLDSSIIYGLLKDLGRTVTAIHINNGEKEFADQVLQPGDSMNYIEFDEMTMASITPGQAVAIHQSPVDLGSVIPQIAMGRKLRQLGFHAVMTGDGADELFGGYKRAAEYDSQYSDTFCELPYYHLPKLDRTMMKSTIELRAPFLAPNVIRHALNTDYSERNGVKRLLKETFKNIVPQSVLDRDKVPLKTKKIRTDPMKVRKDNEYYWRVIYG